ncbi:hypothetical protein NEAUS06_2116 [Nematocida ausubeli]|nr:hypothetical protein NEAUS06_2106 [Nematocida ausubeli]KAI5137151.1 hypothetical protein NEAUS06_2116 [Nematocida ausubeli]
MGADALITTDISNVDLSGLYNMANTLGICRIINKLRTTPNYNRFILYYINNINSNSITYRACNILQGKECKCEIKSREGGGVEPGCDNLIVESNLLHLLTLNLHNKVILYKLIDIISICNISNIIKYICDVDVLMEYVHVLYVYGYYYESYRMILNISGKFGDLVKISPEINIIRFALFLKYFQNNYRMYGNIIRLLLPYMEILPDKEILKYQKYQKVITDYDKYINTKNIGGVEPGHKTKNSSQEGGVEPVPSSNISCSMDKMEVNNWQWYTSVINSSVSIQDVDELIDRISFLKMHRLSYTYKNGILSVGEGNTSSTYIDYISELDKDYGAAAKIDRVKGYAEIDTVKKSTAMGNPGVSQVKQSIVKGDLKKFKSKIMVLFERREYLLRNTLKNSLKNNQNFINENNQLDRVRVAELAVINDRFKIAKKKQLLALEIIVESNPVVTELMEKLMKLLPESKLSESKQIPERITEKQPEKFTEKFPQEEEKVHWKVKKTEFIAQAPEDDQSGVYRPPTRESNFLQFNNFRKNESEGVPVWNKREKEEPEEAPKANKFVWKK